MGKNKTECLKRNEELNKKTREEAGLEEAFKLYSEIGKQLVDFWETLTDEEKKELDEVREDGTIEKYYKKFVDCSNNNI